MTTGERSWALRCSLRPGASVTVDGLREFCRDRLASYKVPEVVGFFDDLPRNATGKHDKAIDRRADDRVPVLSSPMEFHLYLPQMRLSPDDLVTRAQAAEAAGFTGLALMDHLDPPAAEGRPMFEAFTTATWLAAHTTSLVIGHLVLCDAFRHPSVLARQATTLDHLSSGRFELGLGTGSVLEEFRRFGVPVAPAVERAARLSETLDVVRGLWTGHPFDFDGVHHQLRDAHQAPAPTRRIPIVIGGSGRRTLELARRHTDWWNVPLADIARLGELRPHVGDTRVSVLLRVGFAASSTSASRSSRRPCAGSARSVPGWSSMIPMVCCAT